VVWPRRRWPRGAAAGARHFDRLAVEDAGPAAHHLHAVLLQQRADAAGQALDDAVLPGRPCDSMSMLGAAARMPSGETLARVVAGLVEFLGRVDQRLGRDAADVQAGAAQLAPSTSTVLMPSWPARIAAT
jgi:hypothetical protein